MCVSKYNHSFSAIILAGGLGTRLRSSVPDRQKAVASVNGHPFLEFPLRQLKHTGIKEIVLACGYRADSVRTALSIDWPDLIYSEESEPLGTGGAVALAVQKIKTERVLVINGDSFLGTDLSDFLRESNSFPAMLALTEVSDVSRYGAVTLNGNKICSFSEKGMYSGAGLINAGIYSFQTSFLRENLLTKRFSMENDIFPLLMKKNCLWGMKCKGAFIDIGTPSSFELAGNFFRRYEHE